MNKTCVSEKNNIGNINFIAYIDYGGDIYENK